nr:hypothetical protein B0A51_09099 [Rachicladosporium sp. CCFEE 5018]
MAFSDHATLTYTILGLFSVSALAFLLSQPTDFAKWVQKKKYQYEVTFALYMLTPTERFIFNSVLFLFVAMTSIAAALYLPDHISEIARRGFYYWAGEAGPRAAVSTKGLAEIVSTSTEVLGETAVSGIQGA